MMIAFSESTQRNKVKLYICYMWLSKVNGHNVFLSFKKLNRILKVIMSFLSLPLRNDSLKTYTYWPFLNKSQTTMFTQSENKDKIKKKL